MATETEKLNFLFYLLLINLNSDIIAAILWDRAGDLSLLK